MDTREKHGKNQWFTFIEWRIMEDGVSPNDLRVPILGVLVKGDMSLHDLGWLQSYRPRMLYKKEHVKSDYTPG